MCASPEYLRAQELVDETWRAVDRGEIPDVTGEEVRALSSLTGLYRPTTLPSPSKCKLGTLCNMLARRKVGT